MNITLSNVSLKASLFTFNGSLTITLTLD